MGVHLRWNGFAVVAYSDLLSGVSSITTYLIAAHALFHCATAQYASKL
jgi:hypothetical protein